MGARSPPQGGSPHTRASSWWGTGMWRSCCRWPHRRPSSGPQPVSGSRTTSTSSTSPPPWTGAAASRCPSRGAKRGTVRAGGGGVVPGQTPRPLCVRFWGGRLQPVPPHPGRVYVKVGSRGGFSPCLASAASPQSRFRCSLGQQPLASCYDTFAPHFTIRWCNLTLVRPPHPPRPHSPTPWRPPRNHPPIAAAGLAQPHIARASVGFWGAGGGGGFPAPH